MMNSFLNNFFFYNSELVSVVAGSVIALLWALLLLPYIQALLAYDKQKWLEKEFSKRTPRGEEESRFRHGLLEASKPSQSFPIYKIFKFNLASAGILAVFGGLLILLLPEQISPEAFDKILFLPLLIGLTVYFVCNTVFFGHGLWREVSALFLYVGVSSTIIMAYFNFEIYEWFRSDLLAFIVLSIGLAIVYRLKSILASYIYMILIAVSAAAVGFFVEDNWLSFLPQMLWLYGTGILYFWLPRLRKSTDVGPGEIIFAVLFLLMIMSLAFFQLSGSSGLYLAILTVILPGLYIFSKAYFNNASTIFGRPIEIAVILLIVVMGFLLSSKELLIEVQRSISLVEDYSFHKQFSYIVLLGLIVGIFYTYSNEIEENEISLNPGLMWFPFYIFIVSYLFPASFGCYLILIYLIWMGYGYVTVGLRVKSELKIFLGVSIVIIALVNKFIEFFSDDLLENINAIGIALMFWGIIFIGIVIYLRDKWQVTRPSITELPDSENILNEGIE